jgi:hypothetical protein
MAKANLVLPDGTKVNIEGTADEVATLLARFSGTPAPAPAPAATKPARRKKSAKSGKKDTQSKRKGPQTLIEDLIQENFFKAKRNIGEIQ